VRAAHDLTNLLGLAHFVVGSPQRVVEYHDALRATLGFDQVDHFLIVDAADFVLVVEILHLGRMRDEAETVAVDPGCCRLYGCSAAPGRWYQRSVDSFP
jgi:hypothetical protein